MKADGVIKIQGEFLGEGPLFRDEDGTLRSGEFPVHPGIPADRCRYLGAFPYWETRGNSFSQMCPEEDPKLGTLVERPLKFITSATERMRISHDGKVGIGVSTPLAMLHVQGDMLLHSPHGSIISTANEIEGIALWARNNYAAWGLSIDPDGMGHILGDINDPRPALSFSYDKVEVPTRLVIGDVETPNGYRLFVQEGILAERVKVAVRTSDDWSDHVFQPGYRLLPLKDVAAFIEEHGHLPGVPSAVQMVEGGLDVVKTDAMLMEKIEEITLHLIGMEKRVAELEKENGELRQLVGKH